MASRWARKRVNNATVAIHSLVWQDACQKHFLNFHSVTFCVEGSEVPQLTIRKSGSKYSDNCRCGAHVLLCPLFAHVPNAVWTETPLFANHLGLDITFSILAVQQTQLPFVSKGCVYYANAAAKCCLSNWTVPVGFINWTWQTQPNLTRLSAFTLQSTERL